MYTVCHALWNRKSDLLAILLCCLFASLNLGVICSAIATWGEIYWGRASMAFRWGNVIAGSTGSSFVLGTWCVCYFGIKHYQIFQAQRVQLAESALHARDAQLRALRYQLHPHFLFNTLNAISTVVFEGESLIARQMLAKLGDLLRTTLDHPENDSVSLGEELRIVEEYVSLERFRFGERLVTTFQVEPQVMEAMVPRLFLQPVIENAIRHGISKRSRGGRIAILVFAQLPTILITIENDTTEAQPILPARLDEKRGVGLSNTSTRLRHFYGEGAATLKALSRPDGIFEVSIRIPFVKEAKETEIHEGNRDHV